MRNLKKFLALVLAMMMVFSLMVTVSAAPSTAEDAASKAAADKLDKLKVLEGFDGSLQLDRKITRAQMAAIIYRIMTGDLKDDDGNDNSITNFGHYASVAFSDVDVAPWAKGYIGFCANHDILVGYPDGTVKPDKYINGYQVLAMLLRAVGYGQKHEYEGDDWQWDVAHDGAKYGIYAGVVTPTNYDLGQETPRGVVAQMTENAVFDSYMVKYNALTGYNSLETTLMTEVEPLLGANQWGDPTITYRALYNWYDNVVQVVLVNGKSKELDPDYENKEHVRVDECDIAHALGLEKNADIESIWIDGYPYTPAELQKANANGTVVGGIPQLTLTTDTLGLLEETSYVGGQGTQLRVYKMPAGDYRFVLVNTYLAQVTDTTEATKDKNQHPVAATTTFTAWVGDDDHPTNQTGTVTTGTPTLANLTVTTDAWAKGDYALVYLNYGTGAAKLTLDNIIKPAYPVAPGAVTKTSNRDDRDLTPGSTTVGGKSYENAAQFHYFNGRNTKQAAVTNKDTDGVIMDLDGNIIGLTPVSTNYLLVESIQWNPNGTAKGGDVKANVVPMDGVHNHNAIVSKIAGSAIIGSSDNNTKPTFGTAGSGGAVVSNKWSDNTTAFSHRLTTYTSNDDGTISLVDQVIPTVNFDGGLTVPGSWPSNIGAISTTTTLNKIDTYSVSDSTVFFIWNKTTEEYERVTGKANLPAMTGVKGYGYDLTSPTDNYLDVVVIFDYTTVAASNTFVGYVGTGARMTNDGTRLIGSKTYQGYRVIDIATGELREVWFDIANSNAAETDVFGANYANANIATGLYYFVVDGNGVSQYNAADYSGPYNIKRSHILVSDGTSDEIALKDDVQYGEPNYSWYHSVQATLKNQLDTLHTTLTVADNGAKLSGKTLNKQFNVSDSTTKVWKIETVGNETTRKAISLSQIGETDTLLIGFKTDAAGFNTADYIVVYSKTAGPVVQTPPTQGQIDGGEAPEPKDVGDGSSKTDQPELSKAYEQLGIDIKSVPRDDKHTYDVTVTVPSTQILADFAVSTKQATVAKWAKELTPTASGNNSMYAGVYLGGILKGKITSYTYSKNGAPEATVLAASLGQAADKLNYDSHNRAYLYLNIGDFSGTNSADWALSFTKTSYTYKLVVTTDAGEFTYNIAVNFK